MTSSCPNYCLAVGSTGGSALAEVWSGGAWSTTSEVVLPKEGSSYQLKGVSCVSSIWCLTVGSYTPGGGSGGTRGISSRWSGSSWNSVGNLEGPPEFAGQVIAYGVSCVSTMMCVAVGTAASSHPFADYYFGGWSLMTPFSLPAGATGGELRGVSCFSEVHCEASGWSFFGGTPTGLIETYS